MTIAIRRSFIAGILLLAATICNAQKVPRQAPDLLLSDVTGETVSLSGYRGDVVVVAFMVTGCPHCQFVSQQLQALYQDLRGRGLRVVGGVFNSDGDPLAFSNRLKLLYPVGSVPRSVMENFMGFQHERRVGTPQLAFIDRKGRIRAQSEQEGTPLLQQPEVIRSLVESLLKEPR
jgi:peroxiredoxin